MCVCLKTAHWITQPLHISQGGKVNYVFVLLEKDSGLVFTTSCCVLSFTRRHKGDNYIREDKARELKRPVLKEWGK